MLGGTCIDCEDERRKNGMEDGVSLLDTISRCDVVPGLLRNCASIFPAFSSRRLCSTLLTFRADVSSGEIGGDESAADPRDDKDASEDFEVMPSCRMGDQASVEDFGEIVDMIGESLDDADRRLEDV